MSLINLISLIVLFLTLVIGLLTHRYLKRYFKNVDGVIGITNQNEKEMQQSL